MIQFLDFEQLLTFEQEVLSEIVREGELRLSCQFSAATAADQRALTLVGFQTTAATAVIGASTAILISVKPNVFLIYVGFFLAFGLLFSAFRAMDTVRPKLFSFPGNFPINWFPMDWISHTTFPTDKSLKRAKIEQCYGINNAITENQRTLEKNAKSVQFSIDFSFWSITCASLSLLFYTFFILYVPPQ